MDDSNNTLGKLIHAAREQSGRQIADIAAELHINAAHLQALESEELDKLPSPSFAKGYIRAYARALEIDPEPLLKAYLRQAPPAPVWQANQAITDEREKSLTPVVLITVVVVATLVALFVVWFLNSGYLDKESTVVDEATSETGISNGPLFPEPQMDSSAAGGEVTLQQHVSRDAAPAAATPAATDAAVAADGAATVIKDSEKKAPADTAAPVKKAQESKEKEPSKPAAKRAAARLAPSKDNPDLIRAPDGNDKVVISLSADSWVEVTDAKGRRLLRGLYLKDARKTLIGKAPFQVFLGNAPAVTLQAGGKPFDVKRYLRPNKTARFAVLNH